MLAGLLPLLRGMLPTVGLTVLLAVLAGGGYLWHSLTVSRLETALWEKDTRITGLSAELREERQRTANLEARLTALEAVRERERQMADELARENERMRSELEKAREAVDDGRNRERLEKHLRGRKAELMLRIVNNQSRCFTRNFWRTDGRCVAGRFVPDRKEKKPEG